MKIRLFTNFGNIVFAILLPLHTLVSQSVNFAPIGAEWRYNSHHESITKPYGADQYRYVVTKDTLIKDWNARVLQGEIWTNGAFVPYNFMKRYVSTNDDKVYHWVDTTFVLLYDFAALPGDTIYSAVDGNLQFENYCYNPYGNYLEFAYIIDSVSTIEIDGEILRTQYIHRHWQANSYWNILGIMEEAPNAKLIERIGAYPAGTWFGGNTFCIQVGTPASLRCYKDNNIFFEGDTQSLPCDSVVSVSELQKHFITVGPNPFSDEIYINASGYTLNPGTQFYLFNYLGQPIAQMKISEGFNNLNINVPSGIYFWEIRQDVISIANGKLMK